MISKTVFIDTNIFLHYQSFDEIDWLSLLGADHARIYIAGVVIQELDKHKYGPSKKLRDKATKVIRKLHKLASTGLEAKLKKNIYVRFEIDKGSTEFENSSLDPNSQDDRLLASILAFRDAHPDSLVTLVVADLGLYLKAKCYQIEAINLPDDLKLSSELDETEQRIKELEKEVLEIRRKIPELRLCFSDYSNRFNYEIEELSSSNFDIEEEIKRCIENSKEEFPQLPEIQTGNQLANSSSMTIRQIFGSNQPEILPSEIASYNKRLEEFYESYGQYWAEYISWLEIRCRIFMVEISIFNSGTCPADDIDISMHFPDGFTLCNRSGVPDEPEEPKLPSRPTPRTRKERLSLMTYSPALPILPQVNSTPYFQNESQSNVSPPNINHSNSYDVNIHVHKLKQNTLESFEQMFIIFDSFDQVSSFKIDYRIIAENLPKPVMGELHLIFSDRADS